MTDTRRVRLTPDARREQLLQLGSQMLADRTLDELSIDALAERAGISRGLLFHYFRNKQDFHQAVVARAAARLLERTVPDRSLDPATQLTHSLRAFVDYVQVNSAGYIALVRGASGVDDHLQQIFEDTRSALAARVTARLPTFGLADSPTVRLLVRGWIALVEEVVLQWVSDPVIAKSELLDVLVGVIAEPAGPSGNRGTPTGRTGREFPRGPHRPSRLVDNRRDPGVRRY